MASITSTGLGSNLPVDSIIQALVKEKRVPIDTLQTRTDTIKTQISAYGKIQSAISAMRDASAKLTNPSTWAALTATSSDTTMATVAAGSGSGAGSYALKVTSLASSQSLSSTAFATGSGLGSGTLTIELGQWNADQSGFTAKSGASPVSITIDPGADSLTAIRDKINGAGAGVIASVVTDASGQRLVVRSKDTGQANGFRISATDGDGNPAAGLSALAYDPSSGINGMTQNVKAANAQFSVNGLAMSTASNSIEGAVDGLSINLLKAGDSTITVGQDKDSVKKAVTDFVASYNSLMTLMRDQTKYDAASKTAGTLQGDSTAVGLQGQLRSITAGGTTLGGEFSRLADIGLNIGSNGAITVDDSKLSKALANVSDMKNLFMGLDTSTPQNTGNNGIAQRWRAFADQVLGTDGSVTTRTKGLQDRATSNGKRMDEMEDRITAYEKRVRAQYTALDKTMAKLSDTSSYVSKISSMLGS